MQLSLLDPPSSPASDSRIKIAQVKKIFENVFYEFKARSVRFISIETFHVEFYPYASLKHTLRRNEKGVTVRLSGLAEGEDEMFFVALANMLWAKIFGIKENGAHRKLYHEREKEIAKACPPSRRKIFLPPQGAHHNLENIFNRLNDNYFESNFKLGIGWSKRWSAVRLGHYDPSHRLIVLSRILDQAEVPGFVVDAIVYHEMLHHRFPVEDQNGRAIIHSSSFKKADRAFVDYTRSQRWLKYDYPKLVRKLT